MKNYLAIDACAFLVGVGTHHVISGWLGVKNPWISLPLAWAVALLVASGAGLFSVGD